MCVTVQREAIINLLQVKQVSKIHCKNVYVRDVSRFSNFFEKFGGPLQNFGGPAN